MSVLIDDRPLTDTVRDVLTLEGHLAPAVAVRASQPIANAASVWGSSVTVAPRTVTVGLDVWPTTLPDRVTALDLLTRRVGGLRLLSTTDSTTREMFVTLSALDVELYHHSIPRCFVSLTFTAADPTRYEREPRTVALSTTRAAVAVGVVPSAPLLWLYGASPSVVNPVVMVYNAAGDETHRLTLTGTLATNDALLIDCARQRITRYVAGVVQTGTAAGDAWLTSGTFPLFDPADSIEGDGLTVALSSTSGSPTGLVLYTRGY